MLLFSVIISLIYVTIINSEGEQTIAIEKHTVRRKIEQQYLPLFRLITQHNINLRTQWQN
jgi:hypothetical protein